MKNGKCKDCRYWGSNESSPTDDFAEDNLVLRADCRRFPEYQDHHENDWCGEFESKEVKEYSTVRDG